MTRQSFATFFSQNKFRASFMILTASLTVSGCSQPQRETVSAPNEFDVTAKGDIQDDSMGGFNSDPVLQGELPNWFTKDPGQDNVEGMSVDRAYVDLGLKPGAKIVVAVIDSGVDINHEDLKNHIWVNAGEIPANQIDDDKNGYVDDVNGWNFIGGHDASGKNINISHENLEETREVVRLKKLKANGALSAQDEALLTATSAFVDKKRASALALIKAYSDADVQLQALYPILKEALKLEYAKVSREAILKLVLSVPSELDAQKKMIDLMGSIQVLTIASLQSRVINAQITVDYYVNENLDERQKIVGDDPYNYSDRNYGNNDVAGADPMHGTHVSGMIAAQRANGLGMDGVSNEVQIMSIRTVPDGDERDKDIANAVRYAVDNGARVINMSFGKTYSPGKAAVDSAFAYAEAHGVLLIHAAGNDNKDNDVSENYPNRFLVDSVTGQVIRQITTWLEIGASSSKKGVNLPAAFSNYGQKNVDIFAPGVRVYSTLPQNKYGALSGTSMATPATAGVASLILSQHPTMSAAQVKTAMLNTARRYNGLMVTLPGSGVNGGIHAPANPIQSVLFAQLSSTGGIVDALAALKSLINAP